MRRLVVLAVAALVLGTATVGFAVADDQPDPGVGILTEGGTECVLLSVDGDPVIADSYQRVLTPTRGEVDPDFLRCSGFVPNPTGRALILDQGDVTVSCGLGLVGQFGFFKQTDVWHQVISASGRATLTCHD